MLTASISGRLGSAGSRWAAIQSRPQTYHDTRPEPPESRMRTAHRRTPGATPTTPMPLSSAPTIPATCVPWPLPSSHAARLEVEQLTPPTTLRSGWSLSMPVSTMATSASTRWSMPSMREIGLRGANTRRTPRGVVWASSEITPSGTTASTFGSARRAGDLGRVQLRGVPVDDVAERVVDGDAQPARARPRGVDARAVLQEDDPAASRIDPAAILRRVAARGRAGHCGRRLGPAADRATAVTGAPNEPIKAAASSIGARGATCCIGGSRSRSPETPLPG